MPTGRVGPDLHLHPGNSGRRMTASLTSSFSQVGVVNTMLERGRASIVYKICTNNNTKMMNKNLILFINVRVCMFICYEELCNINRS